MTQDDIFLNQGEANAWFERNRDKLISPHAIDEDLACWMMDVYHLSPGLVLEVGASNGWRLEAIRQRHFGAQCFGVEPSVMAIEDGQQRYPYVQFRQGTASDIPFYDSLFQLVIVSYVFHWIDRSLLLASMAEIDRVLASDGCLIIQDFAPDHPSKVAYKHREGLWTYKQDYPSLFTATSLYTEIARITYDHDQRQQAPDVPSQSRAMCCLLRKEASYRECKLV